MSARANFEWLLALSPRRPTHERPVRSHARQAKGAGVTKAEMEQVVLLSLTTIGLPSMVAARTWVASALA